MNKINIKKVSEYAFTHTIKGKTYTSKKKYVKKKPYMKYVKEIRGALKSLPHDDTFLEFYRKFKELYPDDDEEELIEQIG